VSRKKKHFSPPPTEFECNGSSIYDESMTLTWKEPATPNGYIENYIIYDATRNMSIPTDGSVLKQLIVNLSPGRKNVGHWRGDKKLTISMCENGFHKNKNFTKSHMVR
jgi:hypothetical protein